MSTIKIVSRWDSSKVLFESDTAQNVRECVVEAIAQVADLSRANLSGANLSGADLSGADLSRANLFGAHLSRADLSGADLSGANLFGAHLSRADLSGADLSGAHLSGANLSGANLSGANLSGADLSGADLSGANLSGAHLSRANLSGANLSGAHLSGAHLSRADLSGADLSGAHLSRADLSGAAGAELAIARTRILPDEGAIIGWKKCRGGVIVKLLIPAEAKRSHAFGRKCRAEWVEVLEVFGAEFGLSMHDATTVYRKGEIVRPDAFSDNWQDECAPGIHFFITRIEAENYN
jgi:uncharacterized protein YjbI with pentapeptide repeats